MIITKNYSANIYKKIGERVNSLSSPSTSNYFINSSKKYKINYSDIYYKYISQVYYEKETQNILELSTNTLGILLSNVKTITNTYLYYYVTDVELLKDYEEYVGADYLLVGTTLYHNNSNTIISINDKEYLSKPVLDLTMDVFYNYPNVTIYRNKDNFRVLIAKEAATKYEYKLKSKYLLDFSQIQNSLLLSETTLIPLSTYSLENTAEYLELDIFSMTKLKYPIFSLDEVGLTDIHTYQSLRSNLLFNFSFSVYVYLDLTSKFNPILVSINKEDNLELLCIIEPYYEIKDQVKNPYYENKLYQVDYNSFDYTLDMIPDTSTAAFLHNKFKSANISLNLNDLVTNKKFYLGFKLSNKVIYHQNNIKDNLDYSAITLNDYDYSMLDEIIQTYPYTTDGYKYYTYEILED